MNGNKVFTGPVSELAIAAHQYWLGGGSLIDAIFSAWLELGGELPVGAALAETLTAMDWIAEGDAA